MPASTNFTSVLTRVRVPYHNLLIIIINFLYQDCENKLSIISLALIKSSKVSNKGTTLNYFLFLLLFEKRTDKISDAEVVIEIT